MMDGTTAVTRPGLIQVKLRQDVKEWIQARAREQERSQGWMAAKLLEDAMARAKVEAAGEQQ